MRHSARRTCSLIAAAAALACTVTTRKRRRPRRAGAGGAQRGARAGGAAEADEAVGFQARRPNRLRLSQTWWAALAPLAAAVTAARTELGHDRSANARNDVAVRAAVEKLREAQLALATARAAAFAILQAGPNRLNA